MKQVIFQIEIDSEVGKRCEVFEYPVRISYDGNAFVINGETLFFCDTAPALLICNNIATEYTRFNLWLTDRKRLIEWGTY